MTEAIRTEHLKFSYDAQSESGGVMVFIWKLLLKPMGGILNIYELLPAFLISCIFIVVVSKMTKTDPRVQEDYDTAMKELNKLNQLN